MDRYGKGMVIMAACILAVIAIDVFSRICC